MKLYIGAAFLILSFSSFNLAAQEYGFYVGGSVGYSNFGGDADEEAQDIQSELSSLGITTSSISVDLDDSDIGWKFFAGYNFNEYFSAEAGYVDLGKTSLDADITATIPPSVTPVSVSATADVAVDGFNFYGIAGYPINEQFDVYAKAGAFFWSADIDATASITGFPTSAISESDDGTDFTFGIGAKFHFNEYLTLRAEWERYSGITDSDGDIDLFSGGIQYNF